jgi:hypothetical protein
VPAVSGEAGNSLAVQALVGALTSGHAIVDERSTQGALTEIADDWSVGTAGQLGADLIGQDDRDGTTRHPRSPVGRVTPPVCAGHAPQAGRDQPTTAPHRRGRAHLAAGLYLPDTHYQLASTACADCCPTPRPAR